MSRLCHWYGRIRGIMAKTEAESIPWSSENCQSFTTAFINVEFLLLVSEQLYSTAVFL
jgi:hypothetical protein